jgi:hypothetical protein
VDGFDIALSIGALLADALLGFESTAFGGFGLFLGLSFHRGHGKFLRLKWFLMRCEGNHTPVKAEMRRDGIRQPKGDYKRLKVNRLHEGLDGKPHKIWLNAQNGKIRFILHPFQGLRLLKLEIPQA